MFKTSFTLHKSELESFIDDWEKMADHPAVDPYMFIKQLSELPGISPCILSIQANNKTVAMIIAELKEISIRLSLKYFTIWRPKAKVIHVLDQGILGECDNKVAIIVLE